jgi:copper transport protein
MRRTLRSLALLVCLGLLAPASAAAHARLEATSPPQGATVKREPAAVVFTFDESVEGNFGAVRVYDAQGQRVDEGDAFHPNGEGPKLGVHLKPSLPDGSYTATYRVVSADGHIVSSGYVFSIGKPGVAPKQTVAELVGNSGSGTVTEAAFGIARGLEYAALALGVGAFAFLVLIWGPAFGRSPSTEGEWEEAARGFLGRTRLLVLAAAALGILAAAAQIVLEGAEAAGVSGFSALRETIVRETLETHFGTVWGWAAVAWVLIAVLALAVWRRPRPRLLIAVPSLYLVMVPALGGHASTQSPVALDFPVNVVHVAAMALWLGGLATMLVALPAATRALAAPERAGLLAANVARFSGLALAMVTAILATGLIQAYVYVRHLDDLTTTGYGRAVLAKLVLLLVVIGFAAYNRRRSVPELRAIAVRGAAPGRAGVMLRRALRAEVALLIVVLGVTAALASYAPPVSASSGPFSATETLGPTQLEISVEPARVGANEVHVYLFDSVSGAPYAKVKELRITAAEPAKSIGPLPLRLHRAGPGHYIASDALLNGAGEWKLEVTLRVSAFDEFTETVGVPIR